MIKPSRFLAPAACLIPVWVAAQTAPPPSGSSPINTDRPSYSDAAALVSKGQLQFEAGVTATTLTGSTSWAYGQLLTRYGLSDHLELRLNNVTWTHFPGQTDGLQDPSIGFKLWLQTGSAKRPDLTAEFMTTVPVGAAQFRVNRPQPTVRLLWNQQIDALTSIAGNFLVSDVGPEGSRFIQWAETAYITRTINPKIAVDFEVYRIEPIGYGGPSPTFYDAGITYLLNNDFQLDASYGAGFDPQTYGRNFGVGVSYRFDGPRSHGS